MSAQATEAKQLFLQLSRREQVELMQFFLEVIGNTPVTEEEAFELSEAWQQELNRREEEVLSGKVEAIALEKALQSLR